MSAAAEVELVVRAQGSAGHLGGDKGCKPTDPLEAEYEMLFGVNGQARAMFNPRAFLVHFHIHVLFTLFGPVWLAICLLLQVETRHSLRAHCLLGWSRCVVNEWTLHISVVGMAVLVHRGWALPAEFLVLLAVVICRQLFVTVKYGFFAPHLLQRLRTEANCFEQKHVALLACWETIPVPLVKVELRRAWANLQGCWSLRLRALQTPAWMKEESGDIWRVERLNGAGGTLPEGVMGVERLWHRKTMPVVEPENMVTSIRKVEGAAGTAQRPKDCPVVAEICLHRLAELVVLAIDEEIKPQGTGIRKRLFGWLFALEPLVVKVVFWREFFDVTEGVELTSPAVQRPLECALVFVPLVIIIFNAMQYCLWTHIAYAQVAAQDLRRRYHMHLAVLALMGDHALADLPGHPLLCEVRHSPLAGLHLDLSDPGTVLGLHGLFRTLRIVGREWSIRIQIFLAILLLMTFCTAAFSLVFTFGFLDTRSSSRFRQQVYKIVLPMLGLGAAPGIVATAAAMSYGLRLNRIGEMFLPLALSTARSAPCIAGTTAESRMAAEVALRCMAEHVAALQVAAPVRVLGVRVSTQLVVSVIASMFSLLMSQVKLALSAAAKA